METTTDTTTDNTTGHVTDVVDAYLAMWNEEDAATRAQLIERAWRADGVYRDPLLEGDGHAGLDEMVATVQSHYPGHRFVRTSDVDAHHDALRFSWELRAPDGAVFVAGIDVGVVDPDGRLARITGFFG